MNYKGHWITFGLAWLILTILNFWLDWAMPIRALCGILVIPWLNPDLDQAIDPESHRLFLSHSMLPAVLFWYCFMAVVPEYSALIFLIGGFYPWIHLIGDLGGVRGYGLISIFPYIKYLRNHGKWKWAEYPGGKTLHKVNLFDKTWYKLSRRKSFIWLVGNIIVGVIFFVFLLIS